MTDGKIHNVFFWAFLFSFLTIDVCLSPNIITIKGYFDNFSVYGDEQKYIYIKYISLRKILLNYIYKFLTNIHIYSGGIKVFSFFSLASATFSFLDWTSYYFYDYHSRSNESKLKRKCQREEI